MCATYTCVFVGAHTDFYVLCDQQVRPPGSPRREQVGLSLPPGTVLLSPLGCASGSRERPLLRSVHLTALPHVSHEGPEEEPQGLGSGQGQDPSPATARPQAAHVRSQAFLTYAASGGSGCISCGDATISLHSGHSIPFFS